MRFRIKAVIPEGYFVQAKKGLFSKWVTLVPVCGVNVAHDKLFCPGFYAFSEDYERHPLATYRDCDVMIRQVMAAVHKRHVRYYYPDNFNGERTP